MRGCGKPTGDASGDKPYIALNDQITKILVIPEAMGECRDKNGYTIIGVSDFLLRYIK
ncbi:MAG: hypothetical protein IAC61_02840 [Firmicutes bacterium]|uniref:Uncharacterized protein n=1 Tax=Candidatus Alloenteromonas pullistercoris TaxID=2840785 RepID=A0A9D9DFZ6_9FIRM|nr:hypothetical protein [Candidatus Enteromonas pullistercoris]